VSGIGGTTSSTYAGVKIDVSAQANAVVAQLGYMPAAMLGMMRLRLLDLVDHHRLSVGKAVGKDFPSHRRAQKMFFALSVRYGAKPGQAKSIEDLYGRSFAIAPESVGREKFWELMQTGGRVQARAPFFIPFKDKGSFANQYAGDGPFSIARSGLVFMRTAKRTRRQGTATFVSATGAPVASGVAIGVLRRSRQSKKRLKFWELLDSIKGKHFEAMEKDVDLAMTVAGQARLVRKGGELAAKLAGSFSQQKQAIFDAASQGVAEDAFRAAAADRLAPGEGGGT
jgi:hypothetical protein